MVQHTDHTHEQNIVLAVLQGSESLSSVMNEIDDDTFRGQYSVASELSKDHWRAIGDLESGYHRKQVTPWKRRVR